MTSLDELKSLQIEVSLFRRNLKKDNITRRRDVQVLQCKSEKLQELRQKFIVAKNNFNSQVHVLDVLNKAKRIVSDIEVRLEEGELILSSRVARLGQTEAASDSAESSDSSDSVNSAGVNFKMTEKFDLKTAASLLPVMDGSERVTKQLIDGIEMYDSMLDDNGKKTFNYLHSKDAFIGKCENSVEIQLRDKLSFNRRYKKLFTNKKVSSVIICSVE
ncbi:hypothetical protein Zmor_004715 [Zophobas morio]|uniref:Uncharacterized protein n=1 Tax=Zophobas morio TaxID=2755281 RepID=A0AA38IS59_9CUCU|nr:hypothetical protein Zmor_004715 [Zophobas morio]